MDLPPPTDEGADDPSARAVRLRLRSEPASELPAEIEGRLVTVLQAEQRRREGLAAELLAGQPDPGPMPPEIESRIAATLASLARERPSELRQVDGSTVVAMVRPRRRPRGWLAAGAAAAGLAAAAVAGAVFIPRLGDTPAPVTNAIQVHVSNQAYDGASLVARARALVARGPSTAPAAGSPLASSSDIESCLRGLGVLQPTTVMVDLATYDGRQAAIVVVTQNGTTTAYVVSRTCSASAPGTIAGPVPVR